MADEWWTEHCRSELAAMIQKQNTEFAAARAEIERLTAKLQARDGECAAKAQIIAQLEAERDEAIVLMDRAGEALKKSAQRREELTAERDEAQTDLGKVILALPTGTGERAAGPVEGVKTMRKRLEAERDEARAQVAMAYKIAAEYVFIWSHNQEVIALPPADAKAALEAYGREKVLEGMKRAADLFKDANHGKHIMDAILAEMEALK